MVHVYFDEKDIMFTSIEEIKNKELATLNEVIEFYVQKGYTIESEGQIVNTKDGAFIFIDGDYHAQFYGLCDSCRI